MTRKVYLTVTVEAEIFNEIEKLRGREKRSTFVNYILKLGLKEFKSNHCNVHDIKLLKA